VNVYVESNFVLELVLTQEQHAACEEILRLCEGLDARLVIPAYSLAEPYAQLIRRHNERKQLKTALDREFGQLARTTAYQHRISELRDVVAFLASSADEESLRLESIGSRLLRSAEVIPLDDEVLSLAAERRGDGILSPQDSLVYASILAPIFGARLDRGAAFSTATSISRSRISSRNWSGTAASWCPALIMAGAIC
jgi:predicted nucleic acid-binding protein